MRRHREIAKKDGDYGELPTFNVQPSKLLFIAVLLFFAFGTLVSVSVAAPTAVDPPSSAVTGEKNIAPHVSQIAKYSDEMLPKELQEKTIEIIKSSDLTSTQKRILIRKLQDIWENKKYFSEKEKEEVFKTAASVLYKNDHPLTVSWGGSDGYNPDGVHNYIAQRAGEEMGLDSHSVYLLNKYALWPDSFGDPYYDHCWFVSNDPPSGGGPLKTRTNAFNAKMAKKYDSGTGDYYRFLSYSMHYMSDLGNPTHTEQSIRSYFMHGLFEHYVANNWVTGFKFKDTVTNHPYYYYKITNPETSAKSLAQISNRYMDHLWDHYRAGNLETDPSIATDTRQLLRYIVAYDMGIVDYTRQ